MTSNFPFVHFERSTNFMTQLGRRMKIVEDGLFFNLKENNGFLEGMKTVVRGVSNKNTKKAK